MAFSPDGKQIVSASPDGTAKIWSLAAEPEAIAPPEFQGTALRDCVIAAGGRTIAATLHEIFGDGPIFVLHSRNGRIRSDLIHPKTGLRYVALNSSGEWLIYCSTKDGHEGTLTLWDVSAGQQVYEWRFEPNGDTNPFLAFSPDGALFACAAGAEISVYELSSRQRIARIKMSDETKGSVTRCLTFSPDGRQIVANLNWEATCALWDIASRRKMLALDIHLEAGRGIRAVAFRPDGRLIAVAGDSGAITIFNAKSGLAVHTLFGHVGAVNSLTFSPDGTRLASGGHDKTIRLWDVSDGEEVLVLRGHSDEIVSLSFDTRGNWLTSASRREIRVWDAAQGSEDARVAFRRMRNQIREWNLVDSLFATLLLKSDVIESLRKDKSLTDEVRASAIEQAERRGEDAGALNGASWKIVARADSRPEEYKRALRWAEAACRIAPDDVAFQNTLGVARLRVGQFADSIVALMRSHEHNSKSKDGPQPGDVAFLAMAHHALGHSREAAAFLQQLSNLLNQDRWKNDAESVAFLQEAQQRFSKKP